MVRNRYRLHHRQPHPSHQPSSRQLGHPPPAQQERRLGIATFHQSRHRKLIDRQIDQRQTRVRPIAKHQLGQLPCRPHPIGQLPNLERPAGKRVVLQRLRNQHHNLLSHPFDRHIREPPSTRKSHQRTLQAHSNQLGNGLTDQRKRRDSQRFAAFYQGISQITVRPSRCPLPIATPLLVSTLPCRVLTNRVASLSTYVVGAWAPVCVQRSAYGDRNGHRPAADPPG
jgi:hypothetical protein